MKKKYFFLLIFSIFISSFVSVFSKMAARHDFFSIEFFTYYGMALLILGGYAIIWQICLEKINLSIAYMARGLLYIFVYAWSFLIFHESMSLIQTFAVIVIFAGVLISQNEKR